jgi:hypothetical protein
MTIAPAGLGARIDLTPAHLHRSLTGAPIGQHALVEAALVWQRLRPPALVSPASLRGYQAIAVTGDEELAARAARVLSELTFSVVSQPDRSAPRWQVDVPTTRYRPVTRALTLVWRDTLRQFGPAPRPTVGLADREAAIALWRMASLIADGGPNPHLLTVGAGTPATAGLLVSAAARLGVSASIHRVRRLPAVVVDQPGQLRLLYTTLLRPPA